MKLFAKRTRTVIADPETAEKLRKERAERDAEKAVQELLELNPSELNSKQRRLVKRYKERHKSESADKHPAREQDESNESVRNNNLPSTASGKDSSDKERAVEGKKESANMPDATDDADICVDVPGETKEESDEEKEQATLATPDDNVDDPGPDAAPSGETAVDAAKTASTLNGNDMDSNDTIENTLNEGEVKKLLEKLNSKQRRKLMRRLEREGNGIVKQVHEEAVQLLKEMDAEKKSANDAEIIKTTQANVVKSSQSPSGKKRKKDWGDLSPEERVRREEQRRMQKEAAERRAMEVKNGTTSKRHPLNSERRRANRRKPKWEGKAAARTSRNNDATMDDEHNTSGYHMRRLKKAGHI